AVLGERRHRGHRGPGGGHRAPRKGRAHRQRSGRRYRRAGGERPGLPQRPQPAHQSLPAPSPAGRCVTAMAAAGPSRRDWYLANLGVVRYLPRDAIDAAQATSADLAPEASDAIPAAPAPVPASDHLRAALATPSAASTSAAKPAPRAEGAPPFECRLGFWQPRADLVVLCAMPPGQRPAGEQLTMLANLLKAIGRLGDGLPPVDLMDWPQAPHLGLQGVPVDIAG